MKKNYKSVVQTGRDFDPYKTEAEAFSVLNPGAYTWDYDPRIKHGTFKQFKPTCDEILELPSEEFNKITKEMEFFLNPATKEKFLKTGFLYKRSALLHGLPGTGKTVVVQRVMKDVVNAGGVVLFVNRPQDLRFAFDILDDLQPETIVLVIFEEIDGMIENMGDGPFLSILDGEIQKENVMYLATTNYINKIPQRLLRPGRFSSIMEIKYPNAEARKYYFKHKLGNFTDLNMWVEKTENLSVDELKEIIQSVYIFNNNIDDVVSRILKTKGINSKPPKNSLQKHLMNLSPIELNQIEEALDDLREKEDEAEELEFKGASF